MISAPLPIKSAGTMGRLTLIKLPMPPISASKPSVTVKPLVSISCKARATFNPNNTKPVLNNQRPSGSSQLGNSQRTPLMIRKIAQAVP